MTTPNQEPFILPESTNQAVFQQYIQPALLRYSRSLAAPIVVFLGGQPGSGKSSLAAYYGKQFTDAGDGIVTVNSDELREYHPEYAALQRNDPDYASYLVNPDTRSWQHKLITLAIDHRRHILLDGTLGGPVEPILETIRQFQQADYRIMVSAMAVPAYQSRLGIYQHYLDQLNRKGHGRWVGMQTHDQVYAQLPERIDFLEQQKAVDEITVFARLKQNRPPDKLYHNQLINGQWENNPGARQALEAHRNRLLTYAEYQAHEAVVDQLYEQLERRNSDPEKRREFLVQVKQTAVQHRNATPADVQLYFDWANDPVTRQQSFTTDPIPFDTHEAWFARKVTDPNALLLVFETHDYVPVGQVRFERKDKVQAEQTKGETGMVYEQVVIGFWDEAVIGLSIDAQFRGKEIATLLIEEACAVLRQQQGDVPVIAYIKPANQASIRAFERAGFQATDESVAGGDALRLVKH